MQLWQSLIERERRMWGRNGVKEKLAYKVAPASKDMETWEPLSNTEGTDKSSSIDSSFKVQE